MIWDDPWDRRNRKSKSVTGQCWETVALKVGVAARCLNHSRIFTSTPTLPGCNKIVWINRNLRQNRRSRRPRASGPWTPSRSWDCTRPAAGHLRLRLREALDHSTTRHPPSHQVQRHGGAGAVRHRQDRHLLHRAAAEDRQPVAAPAGAGDGAHEGAGAADPARDHVSGAVPEDRVLHVRGRHQRGRGQEAAEGGRHPGGGGHAGTRGGHDPEEVHQPRPPAHPGAGRGRRDAHARLHRRREGGAAVGARGHPDRALLGHDAARDPGDDQRLPAQPHQDPGQERAAHTRRHQAVLRVAGQGGVSSSRPSWSSTRIWRSGSA